MPTGPHAPGFKRRLRSTLSWLHLWVGLTVGVLFALIGLSGSVLVFHTDLLRWQHPQLSAPAPVADGRVLAQLFDRWTSQGLTGIDLPREQLPVWQAYFADGSRRYFAPEDGALLLARSEHDDWLLWLHELHTALLGGETGHELVGIVGWIALFMLLTGLYLWWPTWRRMLAHLRMYRGPPVRRWLTWHRGTGAIMTPLLLLLTLTGVGMIYHDGARTFLAALLGGDQAPSAPARASRGSPPDWSQVLANAQAALPDAQLTRIATLKPGDGVIGFRARAAGEWHPNGRSLVFVDAADAHVLLSHDATMQRPGARLAEAIYPLHIGSVGGAAYKWAALLGGLLPTFLLVTGFLFWRRRRGHH